MFSGYLLQWSNAVRSVELWTISMTFPVHRYLLFHFTLEYISIYYNGEYVTFRFPSDARRPAWVAFVVDRGLTVNLSSTLCSRHFVPGVDYVVGNARRRLLHAAVLSLVSV